MARVTGPLLSIDASGKLADTIVFSHWRGIKYARMWLVPTNPNTAAQQAQRTRLANAVAFWKDMLAETHQGCRNYLAGQSMSGFNWAVEQHIADVVAVWVPTRVTVAVDVDMTTPNQATITYNTTDACNGRCLMGTTHRSYFETDIEGAPTITHSHVFTSLVTGTKYYFLVRTVANSPTVCAGEYSGVAT